MSVRVLAATAALLFAILVGAAALLSRQLGWWDKPAPVEWTFVNPTLSVEPGQRVILRPIVEGVRPLRYTFVRSFLEPLQDDEVSAVPHLGAGVEEYEDGEWAFRPPVEAINLCLMGALTNKEWLTDIEPVLEWSGGGKQRMLLKAVFGHRNGSTVAYYYDPKEPVPAFGWTRSEMAAENRAPELYYATDGGVAVLPPPPEEEPAPAERPK